MPSQVTKPTRLPSPPSREDKEVSRTLGLKSMIRIAGALEKYLARRTLYLEESVPSFASTSDWLPKR